MHPWDSFERASFWSPFFHLPLFYFATGLCFQLFFPCFFLRLSCCRYVFFSFFSSVLFQIAWLAGLHVFCPRFIAVYCMYGKITFMYLQFACKVARCIFVYLVVCDRRARLCNTINTTINTWYIILVLIVRAI